MKGGSCWTKKNNCHDNGSWSDVDRIKAKRRHCFVIVVMVVVEVVLGSTRRGGILIPFLWIQGVVFVVLDSTES